MDMGPYAQTKIKGNDVTYYTDVMNEARSKILAKFKKEMMNGYPPAKQKIEYK